MKREPAFKRWTKEEDDYLIANYARLTSNIIASDLGITKQRVKSRITYLGLTKEKVNGRNKND